MEKNRYRNLNEQIHVPAGLNERVLRAAENQKPAAENPGPSQKRRALLRAAVYSGQAVTAVIGWGSHSLHPKEKLLYLP